MKSKKDRVFETDDLSGICYLCNQDLSGHDSDCRCYPTPPPPCGCTVERNDGCGWDDKDKIEYCPLHASAPALRDALEKARGIVDLIAGTYGERTVKRSAVKILAEMNAVLTSCREKGKP